jgi:hypothetical protein
MPHDNQQRCLTMNARLALLGAGVLGIAALVGVGLAVTSPPPHAFQGDDFSFRYPAAWREISGYEHAGMHGPTVLAAVGIGDFDLGCSDVSTGVSCSSPRWTVPGDGVVVAYHVGAWLGPIAPEPSPVLEAGERWVTVGGRPAVYSQTERSMSWHLPGAPEYIEARWGSAAGANARSQLDALIASWAWAPPSDSD